jgi:hypothetical protein
VQKLQRNLQKPRSSSNLSRSRTPQAFCRRKASISSLSSIISLPTHVADHISEEDRNDSLTSGIVVSKSETVSNNSSREQLEKPCETPDNRLLPFKRSETLTILEETSSRKQSDSNPTSTREKYLPFGAPGSILAMQCHDLNRVREIIPFLIDHTITTCEERISKLINARSKVQIVNSS